MGIEGISDWGTAQNILDYLKEQQDAENKNNVGSLIGQSSSSSANKANSAYSSTSGAMTSVGQSALNKALEELSSQTNGKITFSTISNYQKQLEIDFSKKVKKDLKNMGISETTQFTLSMDTNGKIAVDCADQAAKLQIQKYLTKNESACEQFGYIQALGNFDRATKTSSGADWAGMASAKAEISLSSINSFFDSSLQSSGLDYSALTASFSGTDDAVSYFAGINYTV